MKSRRLCSLCAVSPLALIVAIPTAAFAQSAEEGTEGAEADLGAIVVTGTRLQDVGVRCTYAGQRGDGGADRSGCALDHC